MKLLRFLSFAITFLTFFVAAPTPVDAQLTRGTIKGTITDPNKALVPETRVVIRNFAVGRTLQPLRTYVTPLWEEI
jgi:hypothetical protein